MERRLGRGLGSLLSDPSPAAGPAPQEIALDRISPNPFQPRKRFDPAGLQELKESIGRHGVLQPVVVRQVEDRFELILGERRWRAARLAGKQTLPTVVRRDVPDEEMLELALVENVQRRDLDPLERALGFRQMVQQLGVTQEQVAEKVGLQRSTVTNHLRLLDLPEEAQKALADGLVSMGHARALLGVQDSKAQRALLAEMVRKDLSVRAVERRVRDVRDGGTTATPTASTSAQAPAWVREVEASLRDSLGTKVEVRNGKDYRGQIVIEYADRASLDRLLTQLAQPARL